MTGRARALLATAALAASACATFPTAFPFTPDQPQPGTTEGVWAEVRDRYTATAKLYDGLTTRAFAATVYQAPEVRERRVARLAVWREMASDERDRLLATERDEGAQYEDFLVSFFTTSRPDNDLDSGRSVWRVALAVEGEGVLEPVKVEALRPDATLRTLYPVIGDFDSVYRVRFARWPKGPLAERKFTLSIAGARGRMDMKLPARPKP